MSTLPSGVKFRYTTYTVFDLGSMASRGNPEALLACGGDGSIIATSVLVHVLPPSDDLATTTGCGALLGASRLRHATYIAPSAPITGGAGSRTCSPGPEASTGADQVWPPSLETAVTSWRSPPPLWAPPEVTNTLQPSTSSRSPLAMGCTAMPGRITYGWGPGPPWIATTPVCHVFPPSAEWHTISESPSPWTTLISGRSCRPRWEAKTVYTF